MSYTTYSLVIMVALAGAFGSIISILIRLQQYKDAEYKGSATPIFVGFAKPLIGTGFAIFVFALINSNIISFPSVQSSQSNQEQQNNEARDFFFFSIAFLVGFSERLANDIVKRTEASLGVEGIRESANTVREASHDVKENIRESANTVREVSHDIKEDIRESANIVMKALNEFIKNISEIEEGIGDIEPPIHHKSAINPAESSQPKEN